MAMNVLQSPSRPGLGKVSGFFWRNPGLGLFLLLLGPLMWFGIVYFGSLLTLLWQGFYTFDDFTMSVTPELTLANIRALFNPANYDIILRTLTMAVAVTIASAILAFPMAWYMARYTCGKMKAFFYIAVMLPMWASYIVKAYAWTFYWKLPRHPQSRSMLLCARQMQHLPNGGKPRRKCVRNVC